MQSPDSVSRALSHHLTVQPTQPIDPAARGIWICIPDRIFQVREGDTPLAQPPTSAAPAPPVAVSPATASPPTSVFRMRGHVREICFAGHVVHLRDMQGFRVYAQLLGRPQSRITAIELRAGLAGVEQSVFAGSTGPVVSGTALAELRRSYEELSEELAEAEEHHDEARECALREELSALADHLRQVVGRDGRPRQQSDGERARVAISKALTRAKSALKEHHPALHQHLARSVVSGTVLCYRPEASVMWET